MAEPGQIPGERPRKHMEYTRKGSGAWWSLLGGSQRHNQRALSRCPLFKSRVARCRQLRQHRYAWYRHDDKIDLHCGIEKGRRAGFHHRSCDICIILTKVEAHC